MFLLSIGNNDTFKKSFNSLVKHGYILTPLEKLPRKNGILVKVNPKIIPKKTGKDPFVQLTSDLLNKSVIDEIGYVGIRLIYYYESYINRKVMYKDRCFASEETIAAHLGITKRTVITYNKKIKKCKFVRIEAHKLEATGAFIPKGKKEVELFDKYNNHYYVNREKISEFVANENGLIQASEYQVKFLRDTEKKLRDKWKNLRDIWKNLRDKFHPSKSNSNIQ